MKKHVLAFIFSIFTLFVFAACRNNREDTNIEFNDIYEQQEPASTSQIQINFATELSNYFEELDVINRLGGCARRAFFVDVDGNGTQGVLAVGDFFSFRLFALYNEELSYIDIPVDISVYITDEGRVMGYFWGDTQKGYTLFGIEDGRVAVSFSIHAQLREELFDCIYVNVNNGRDNIYTYIPNNHIHPWLWGEEIYYETITHEEFYELLTRYRPEWENWTYWSFIEDETDKILGMIE
jgi:hypothetical protein